jgi:predicted PolB exonuclease-like 3'-5' exonuclease
MELFFFDIETTTNWETYDQFLLSDERGAKLFKNKYDKMWSDTGLTIDEAYREWGPIISAYGKIITISYGFMRDSGEYFIKSIWEGTEFDIVNRFNDVLKRIETKQFNLSGFRILNFDIPWILHKCHKWGIKPADIILTYDKKPWEMRIVDLSEDWKGKFAWSPSFDELLYELGLESPKNNLSGSGVHSKYWSGQIDEVVKYCELDVKSCIDAHKMIYGDKYISKKIA